MTTPAILTNILGDLDKPGDMARLCDIVQWRQRFGEWPPIPAEILTPSPPIPPPAPAPLWRGTAIGVYKIRDAGGNEMGATIAGQALAIYAEGVVAGSYANRVVITPPGNPARNVWREGVKKE